MADIVLSHPGEGSEDWFDQMDQNLTDIQDGHNDHEGRLDVVEAEVAEPVTWAGITGKPTTFTPAGHTHPSTQISDSTAVGRAVLTATDAAAARAAIGAASGGIDITDVGYDIVIVAGQSNASGSGLPVLPTIYDVPTDRVMQYAYSGTYAGTVTQGAEPLENVPQDVSAGVGPAVAFGREWAKRTPSNRTVLILSLAVGGVGLVNGPWAVGGMYYQQAITLANEAITSVGGSSRVVAFLWVQGENDAAGSVAGATYQAAFDAAINGYRAAIPAAAAAPFIVGSMVPEWITAPNGTSVAIDAVHAATPSRITNAAYVRGPSGMNQDSGGIHYNAAGARELGRRMCLALFPGTPDTPAKVTSSPRSSQVVLTWPAVFGSPAVTGYTVQRRAVGAGSWTAAGTPTNPTQTVTGLTNGTEYEFRVAAVSSAGTGPWSQVIRDTPSAYAGAVNTDSPRVYLRLDEWSPRDRTGNTTPTAGIGVAFNAATLGDGVRSADCSGANSSRIDAGSPASLTNIGAFTAEAIIRPDALGDRFLIVRDDGGSTRDWRFAIAADNKLEFYKFTGTLATIRGATALTAGTTYHVAVTYNGSTITLYLNGVANGSVSATGTLGATQRIGVAGRSAGDGALAYDGRMAGVAIYSTALTAARILAHAQAAGVA